VGRAVRGSADPEDLPPARDPFERADESSNTYYDWLLDHAFLLVPAQASSPSRRRASASFRRGKSPRPFNLDSVMDKLRSAAGLRPPLI